MSQTPAGPLPLEGIRVLDIATFVAAPFTAAILGEFGAEVIKIEQPGSGDPLRRFGTPTETGDTLVWFSEARNKTCITLDLRRPEGAALFKRLAAVTDVVCENFRPGTLERWGLGWEVLSAINPRLILLRITGYGQTGPYRDRPGFARIAHAFSGLTYLAGMPGGPPVTPGSTSLADYGSGLYGAIGVLLALRSRDQTGRGQVIDIGLYESMFRCLDELAPAFARYDIVREPEGISTRSACPHGHFPTSDGHWVAIACTSDRIFARFATVIGQPELAAPEQFGEVGRRLAHRAEVDRIATDWTTARRRDEVIAQCIAGEVPCGPIYSIAEIFEDPHYAARENLHHVADPRVGDLTVPGVIPKLSETPGRIDSLGPALGAGNRKVFRELLGLDDAALAALEATGIV